MAHLYVYWYIVPRHKYIATFQYWCAHTHRDIHTHRCHTKTCVCRLKRASHVLATWSELLRHWTFLSINHPLLPKKITWISANFFSKCLIFPKQSLSMGTVLTRVIHVLDFQSHSWLACYNKLPWHCVCPLCPTSTELLLSVSWLWRCRTGFLDSLGILSKALWQILRPPGFSVSIQVFAEHIWTGWMQSLSLYHHYFPASCHYTLCLGRYEFWGAPLSWGSLGALHGLNWPTWIWGKCVEFS